MQFNKKKNLKTKQATLNDTFADMPIQKSNITINKLPI